MRKKRISGIIQTYSRKAREQILLIGGDFFKEVGIERHMDDVFSIVDELIKNAVKYDICNRKSGRKSLPETDRQNS